MHVVLFDIDGTLLLSGGAGQRAMERALASALQVTAPTEDIPAAGRTDRAITRDLFRFHGIDETPEARERFVNAYYTHLPETLQELDGCLLPGVVPLLELLSARDDICLGLLTGNFRRGAKLKLAHYQIDKHFRFGGFGDDHFHRDDVARAAVAEATRALSSASPVRYWVVGDTPADVQCGRAIGAEVVAVATGIFSRDELAATSPDHLFDDLSKPDMLLRWPG